MEDLKILCMNCDLFLKYDPTTDSLKCPGCGARVRIINE